MREIEFRGKKVNSGEWLYGDLIHDNIEGCYIYPLDAENLYKENAVIPDTVGQFTGLYDKNKKKIYEGDVVHLDAWNPDAMQIVFMEGAFCMANENREFLGDIHYANNNQCTIIGNIHDNPKLLNN